MNEPGGKDMDYSLDEHSWEEIQEIKKALWIGYNYSH